MFYAAGILRIIYEMTLFSLSSELCIFLGIFPPHYIELITVQFPQIFYCSTRMNFFSKKSRSGFFFLLLKLFFQQASKVMDFSSLFCYEIFMISFLTAIGFLTMLPVILRGPPNLSRIAFQFSNRTRPRFLRNVQI